MSPGTVGRSFQPFWVLSLLAGTSVCCICEDCYLHPSVWSSIVSLRSRIVQRCLRLVYPDSVIYSQCLVILFSFGSHFIWTKRGVKWITGWSAELHGFYFSAASHLLMFLPSAQDCQPPQKYYYYCQTSNHTVTSSQAICLIRVGAILWVCLIMPTHNITKSSNTLRSTKKNMR